MGWQSEDYYKASLERIQEAYFLHKNGYNVVSMYISGLAVECMLRAFRLLKRRTFDERHDLWLLWKSTDLANVHSELYHDRLHSAMGVVGILWRNDYRFRSKHALQSFLKKIGRVRGIKGDLLKYNSLKLYNAAAEVIRIGVNRWHRLNKK